MLFKENALNNYELIIAPQNINREMILLNGSIPFDYQEIKQDISINNDINKEVLLANSENIYNTLYGILNKTELCFNFNDGIL